MKNEKKTVRSNKTCTYILIDSPQVDEERAFGKMETLVTTCLMTCLTFIFNLHALLARQTAMRSAQLFNLFLR